MVAEMFGLGILTLPADFARLGWAVGLGIVLLFCLGMIYSGVLFAQLGRCGHLHATPLGKAIPPQFALHTDACKAHPIA